MTRSEKREIIIKIIYQTIILDKTKEKYNIDQVINEYTTTDEFIINTCIRIKEVETKLRSIGNKYLKEKWTMNRLPIIDQSIILLGTYELLYTNVPNVVVINEAINLSKKYSDEVMPKVVNGVLDSIFHNEERINE